MITLPQELDLIRTLVQPEEQIYLVGGAIRDTLLSKPNKDLDFVGTGDPRIIGRKLAEKLSGAFFVMDEERNACRVIAKNDQGGRLVFDFTQMRGQTLKDDLEERDFTFNAMAVNLANPVEIIDPLKGERDLIEKRLRPCKDSIFRDDPLRVIRAFRYSVKYNLQMELSTIELLKQSVNSLTYISQERKRDELFKILESENACLAIQDLSQYNILTHLILGDLPDAGRAFLRLKSYAEIIKCIANEKLYSGAYDIKKYSLYSSNSEIRKLLQERLNKVNQSERSNQALDGLIAILWDFDEVEGKKAIERLALSREEQEQIGLALRYKSNIFDYYYSQTMPDRKFIYRYFQALGVTGLDLAILSLAEEAVKHFDELEDLHWAGLVKFCMQLVETWFINPDYVNPRLFLTGRDLMFEFDIPQGPLIGKLLDDLREEQAIGLIQNRIQALNWVEGQIRKGFLVG